MVDVRSDRLIERPGIRQFIKFCIVGATSFAVDATISTTLVYLAHFPPLAARTISFVCAVTNGFFWNQRWTFRAIGHRQHHEQYGMFVAVNIVGLLLNLAIMSVVFRLMTGKVSMLHPPKPVWATALLTATVIVTFWNFFANKHWTFRRKH